MNRSMMQLVQDLLKQFTAAIDEFGHMHLFVTQSPFSQCQDPKPHKQEHPSEHVSADAEHWLPVQCRKSGKAN